LDNPQHAFALRLQQLHRRAGKPKQKTLSGVLFCSGPRVSAFLTGRDFPEWQYVERFVVFCGGDLEEFHKLWEATDEQLEQIRRNDDPGRPLRAVSNAGPPEAPPLRPEADASTPHTDPSKSEPFHPESGSTTRRGNLPDPAHSQIILIGSGRYRDDTLPDLPHVGNNLTGIRDVLIDPAISNLRPDNITMCAEPTSMAQFGEAILEPVFKAQDLLLLYYSGHGLLASDGELYLALESTNPSQPAWSAVPMRTIRRSLQDSPARSRVLILDCCFSGRAIEALSGAQSVIYGQTEITGTLTLTSSSGNMPSLAPARAQYTSFTGELLALVDNGIPDGPEYLSLGWICRQMLRTMRSKGLPTPQTHGTNTVDQLDFVRNRAWSPNVTI
jgi:hypothetical protein